MTPAVVWRWCRQCKRCYPRDEVRVIGDESRPLLGRLYCGYGDCDGHYTNALSWNIIRLAQPWLPEVPERGEIYTVWEPEPLPWQKLVE